MELYKDLVMHMGSVWSDLALVLLEEEQSELMVLFAVAPRIELAVMAAVVILHTELSVVVPVVAQFEATVPADPARHWDYEDMVDNS